MQGRHHDVHRDARGALRLFLGSLSKPSVHNFRTAPEIRSLQPPKSYIEINQPTLVGKVENTQGACHYQALLTGNRNPSAVVHEDKFGADSNCERDCRTLALVQDRCGSVVDVPVRIRSNFQPYRSIGDPCPHRRRCIGMCKFVTHSHGHENHLEQVWQDVDCVDQDQIIEGTGIGDNQPHGFLKTESLQIAPLALQIFKAVGLEHVMRLQKTVERVARSKAEQTAQFGLREVTLLVFLKRQGFERAARQIATGSGESLGDIVRNFNDQIHNSPFISA